MEEALDEVEEGKLSWTKALAQFDKTFTSDRNRALRDMSEVPAEGSLPTFFRDLERRLTPSGSLWVVFPKKPFQSELAFPFSWSDVQRAGLACGLVDNKIAAFSPRLTSIRFVVPLADRKPRST